MRGRHVSGRVVDVVALATWVFLAWTLLTWTASVQVVVCGVVVAVAGGLLLAPLGHVARPWSLLSPRRLARTLVLAGRCVGRIVVANLVLARRIWDPRLPIRTGMVVVPVRAATEGGIAAIGLTTSLIVDNQIVDLEPGLLQYHAIWIDSTDEAALRSKIIGGIEEPVVALERAPEGDADA